MGHDVTVSGTLGAAIQGYLHDVPSMAVSLNGYDEELHFKPGARVAALLAALIRDGMLSGHLLLNINMPNLPLSELEGVEITSQSQQSYCDAVEHDENNNGCYFIKRVPDLGIGLQDNDLWAVQQNRVSITPLLNGSTDNLLRGRLQEMAPSLCQELQNTAK